MNRQEFFPDGTPIDQWFYATGVPTLEQLGTPYVLTDYGIADDGRVYTRELQQLIDTTHKQGGGVIVVPRGTFLTGAVFFRQGVHLYVEEGGTLKGSDDIADYPLCETRIEGETCLYYPGLINADGLDGFVLCGPGTIDGNGWRSWRAFWQRRAWNPACTNKDEQRARLVYLSHCRNVLVAGLCLQNAQFWTNHLYKCRYVKYIGCRILSPAEPVAAPSTDAIDIDGCEDVLIKDCYMAANDDSVVLKGGKGPWADTAPENGANQRVLVEDCRYGFCHGCLTCGSESVHNRNVLVRRVEIDHACNLLWLKMRPDTPQHYEYITVEDVVGTVDRFLFIQPWTQFFDRKGQQDLPPSLAEHITMTRCDCVCDTYFHAKPEPQRYVLADFTFADLQIKARVDGFDPQAIDGVSVRNVTVTTN